MALEINGAGNVGRDVKSIRTVKGRDGKEYKVTDFTVCFDEVKKKEDGTYEQTSAIWARVVVWNALAEQCFKLLKKGSRVHIKGLMKNDTWVDDETGEERSMLQVEGEVVSLSLYRLASVEETPRREKVAA
jgi:single-strand DNA-binding protein